MTGPVSRAAERRRRHVGRLLALVLFASPMIPGWWALAAGESGTRMVELCTAEGLRLVRVPAEDATGPAHGQDRTLEAFHCVACPLGNCSVAGATCCPSSVIAQAPAAVPADFVSADFSVRRLESRHLGPPTRGPPAS